MAERIARTRIDGGSGFTSGPSVQTEATRNAVPQYDLKTGFEGLGEAFGRFFNQAQSAIQVMDEAETIQRRAEIQRENKAQALKGQNDAILGKDVDPEMADDLDYLDSRRDTMAKLEGHRLASDWLTNVYAKLGPDADFDKATEDYLKQEWPGSGDEALDAGVLATFKQYADRYRPQFAERVIKNQIDVGVRQQNELIGADIRSGSMDEGKFAQYIQERRTLNPWAAATAPLDVARTILSVAGNDYASAQSVLSLLAKPGTGNAPGKSFFDSFPEARTEVEAALVKKYESGVTLEANQEYDEIGLAIEEATDIGTLADLGVQLNILRHRHGKGGSYDTIRGRMAAKLDKLKDAVILDNQLTLMMSDPSQPVDVSLVNKGQMDFLKKRGINPLQDPVSTAGVVVRQGGIVSTDLKATYSNALLSNDPALQTQAFQFYQALASSKDSEDFALQNMNMEARGTYQAVRALAISPGDIPTLFAQVNDIRRSSNSGDIPKWDKMLGKTESEAAAAVKSAIESSLKDVYGKAHIPDQVLQDLSKYAQVQAAHRQMTGESNLTGIVKDSIKAMQDRIVLVPGVEGRLTVALNVLPETSPIRGEENVRLVRMGTNIYNPSTRGFENTVETFREDAQTLVSSPAFKLTQDPEDVALVPSPDTGSYRVVVNGTAISLVPGGTFLGKPVPKDKAAIREMFAKELEGTGFIAVSEMGGYSIHYRPRLKEAAKSLDQLEQERIDRRTRARDLIPESQRDPTGPATVNPRLRLQGQTQKTE